MESNQHKLKNTGLSLFILDYQSTGISAGIRDRFLARSEKTIMGKCDTVIYNLIGFCWLDHENNNPLIVVQLVYALYIACLTNMLFQLDAHVASDWTI